MSSPLSPIATCPDTNTNGPALTAGENGSGWPPAPVRVPPRNSTLIESSKRELRRPLASSMAGCDRDETKLQSIRFFGSRPACGRAGAAARASLCHVWYACMPVALDALSKERRLPAECNLITPFAFLATPFAEQSQGRHSLKKEESCFAPASAAR